MNLTLSTILISSIGLFSTLSAFAQGSYIAPSKVFFQNSPIDPQTQTLMDTLGQDTSDRSPYSTTYTREQKAQDIQTHLNNGADLSSLNFLSGVNVIELLEDYHDLLLNQKTAQVFLNTLLDSGIPRGISDPSVIDFFSKREPLRIRYIEETIALGAYPKEFRYVLEFKDMLQRYLSPRDFLKCVSSGVYSTSGYTDSSASKNHSPVTSTEQFALQAMQKLDWILEIIESSQERDDLLHYLDPDLLTDNLHYYSADTILALQRLKNLGFDFCKRGRFVFDSEIIENGLATLTTHPRNVLDLKYKNLHAQAAAEPKIPYILHHIWLTHPSNPREIRPQDIENALRTHQIFANAQSNTPWQHIVWTNNLELIPDSVQALSEAGIQVRSIYEYQNELSLFSLVENLIEERAWGMASDTLRYCLIQKFGGVYADINYIFNRDTTIENHTYNYFTISFSAHWIDNFFFGASPNHPIINKLVALVERNLTNPPDYLKEIDRSSTQFTDLATANPTFIAYYLESNKNGTVDVVYPPIDDLVLYNNYRRDTEIARNNDRSEPDFETYPLDTWGSLETSDEEHDRTPAILSRIYSEFYSHCPDVSDTMFWSALKFLDNHEFCATEAQFIGYDSNDGHTWVN